MTHVYLATFYGNAYPRPLGTYRSLIAAVRACDEEVSKYWKGNGFFCDVREVELNAPFPKAWGREVWKSGDPVPEEQSNK